MFRPFLPLLLLAACAPARGVPDDDTTPGTPAETNAWAITIERWSDGTEYQSGRFYRSNEPGFCGRWQELYPTVVMAEREAEAANQELYALLEAGKIDQDELSLAMCEVTRTMYGSMADVGAGWMEGGFEMLDLYVSGADAAVAPEPGDYTNESGDTPVEPPPDPAPRGMELWFGGSLNRFAGSPYEAVVAALDCSTTSWQDVFEADLFAGVVTAGSIVGGTLTVGEVADDTVPMALADAQVRLDQSGEVEDYVFDEERFPRCEVVVPAAEGGEDTPDDIPVEE